MQTKCPHNFFVDTWQDGLVRTLTHLRFPVFFDFFNFFTFTHIYSRGALSLSLRFLQRHGGGFDLDR